MVFSMGMNDPDARRRNKSAAKCFADRWVRQQKPWERSIDFCNFGKKRSEIASAKNTNYGEVRRESLEPKISRVATLDFFASWTSIACKLAIRL
jgi:hypothetical protein